MTATRTPTPTQVGDDLTPTRTATPLSPNPTATGNHDLDAIVDADAAISAPSTPAEFARRRQHRDRDPTIGDGDRELRPFTATTSRTGLT